MPFTQFAQEKDAASFRTAFQDAIQSAVADELEQQKLAIAQSMFGGEDQLQEEMSDEELDDYLDSLSEEELEALAEEVEQMDEISNLAKHRYMGSAVADLTSRSLNHGAMSGNKKYSNSDLAKYQRRKIKNRQMGIARVADTLVKKEEVE